MAADPTSLMDGTYFVSRGECLAWLNGELGGSDYQRVEDCATAVPYLLLARRVFPKYVATASRLKAAPSTEYDRLHNWKLLQDIMYKAGLTRQIDIEKQAKGTYQINLEFLQWFKRVYESRKNAAPASSATGTAVVRSPRAKAAPQSEAEAERTYYFEKLLQVERLVLAYDRPGVSPVPEDGEPRAGTAEELAERIKAILYRP